MKFDNDALKLIQRRHCIPYDPRNIDSVHQQIVVEAARFEDRYEDRIRSTANTNLTKQCLSGECILLRYQVLPAILIVFLLTACSSGDHTTPAAPVFSSTPVTQAVEASPYTYQVAATGTAVAFSLTSAPTGATLSGDTISWTPTAQQSRVSNSFTVTATASGAASATQSWSVTPSGTIRISRIDTLWDETGSTNRPLDWSVIGSYVAALVPQSDGSFKSLSGTPGPNGTFEIPNVPAGYYWLRLGPLDTYWTSSSTFDMGGDFFVTVASAARPTTATTNFNFNFTSLEATATPGLLQVDSPESFALRYFSSTNAGSTSVAGASGIGGNIDYSVIKNAFVRQYEPASFGSVNGYVMGPELTLSNLSLTTGGTNTLSGALNPTVPASINLSVQASAWAPLFEHIAPTAPTATGGGFYLSVQPYIAAAGPNVSSSNPIDLIWTKSSNGFFDLISPSCSTNPPFTTDVDAGTVRYGDPFPSAWRRTFLVCHTASVAVPVPGGNTTQSISLVNTQTTALPTATVKPLISPVQNPKINGTDLFTASTISSTAPVTLTWDPPAIGTPFGYRVTIISPATLPVSTFPGGTSSSGTPPVSTFPVSTSPGIISGGTVIATIGTVFLSGPALSTAKTSMTVPPDLLSSGKTYLFVITSVVDGKANMETSPHRSSLPTASAQLISAPITIQ